MSSKEPAYIPGTATTTTPWKCGGGGGHRGRAEIGGFVNNLFKKQMDIHPLYVLPNSKSQATPFPPLSRLKRVSGLREDQRKKVPY